MISVMAKGVNRLEGPGGSTCSEYGTTSPLVTVWKSRSSALAATPLVRLVTAIPRKTGLAMLTLSEPSRTQLLPSKLAKLEKRLFVRCRRSQVFG